MKNLKNIIEGRDTRWGIAFDLLVQLMIVVSLVSFSLDTLPDLDQRQRQWLRMIEVATVSFFTIEYILRVIVAERPLKYIFSFFGIVDLLAILPFYIRSTLDLRAIRAFRFLRLFRLFKLARYSKAVSRLHLALMIAKEEIVLYLCVTGILLYMSAVGIYYFENAAQPEQFASVFHSLWW